MLCGSFTEIPSSSSGSSHVPRHVYINMIHVSCRSSLCALSVCVSALSVGKDGLKYLEPDVWHAIDMTYGSPPPWFCRVKYGVGRLRHHWNFVRVNFGTLKTYVELIDTLSGWWFGTMDFYDFPFQLGRIIPTDFHIFQRGSNHQPVNIELAQVILFSSWFPVENHVLRRTADPGCVRRWVGTWTPSRTPMPGSWALRSPLSETLPWEWTKNPGGWQWLIWRNGDKWR